MFSCSEAQQASSRIIDIELETLLPCVVWGCGQYVHTRIGHMNKAHFKVDNKSVYSNELYSGSLESAHTRILQNQGHRQSEGWMAYTLFLSQNDSSYPACFSYPRGNATNTQIRSIRHLPSLRFHMLRLKYSNTFSAVHVYKTLSINL